MPEIQVDAAVANRFISSLSKSLQALCHGCMDFDSGIEIVGYININIDSGNKVDYVLNEKVLKSTTNSMTFVSNSFLAKKDQPKQTRDGACSPVAELKQPQFPSSYRMRGGYNSSPHRQPISHSYMHGAQKRSWAGLERDWRISSKKQRMTAQENPTSALATSSSAQYSQSSSTSSQSDANFKWPQASLPSSQSDTGDGESQADINIKKEVFDTDNTNSSNEQEQPQTSDPNRASETSLKDIKRDPDAMTTPTDSDTLAADATDSKDLKSSFLQSGTSDENQQLIESSENLSQSNEDNQASLPDNQIAESLTDQNYASGSTEEGPTDNVSAESETPVEYDDAGDDAAYSQSVYSDAGEGASDSGQFEVIEIDDEDEEVQAMFGGPGVNDFGRRRKRLQVVKRTKKSSLRRAALFYQEHAQDTEMEQEAFVCHDGEMMPLYQGSVEICSICRIALPIGMTYQQHFSEVHTTETQGTIGADPFICEICQKGFVTKERLRQHSSVHDSSYYSCFLCGVKFKHKKNIKRHLESTHSLRKCSYCMALFQKGSEFNDHIINCQSALEAQQLL